MVLQTIFQSSTNNRIIFLVLLQNLIHSLKTFCIIKSFSCYEVIWYYILFMLYLVESFKFT